VEIDTYGTYSNFYLVYHKNFIFWRAHAKAAA